MEQLLHCAVAPEPSTSFFAPARQESTVSAGALTDASSTSLEDVEEPQNNARRITLCKQVLFEVTSTYSGSQLVEMPLLKRAACRNSGALLPLLSMLAAEHETSRVVRAMDTLSFLLMDRANRRACHELRALDVLLDILRRASDQQQVQLSCLEALCSLCKHDAKEKMALWQHPNRGALLSMLNNRNSSVLVIETLRVCRTLCFAAASGGADCASSSAATGACNNSCCSLSERERDGEHRHRSSHSHTHGPLQLLEPALLTVTAELLHPSTDVSVLLKALKLLHVASAHVGCAKDSPGCCGCWHNAMFRLVPLLTHCADMDVVESALAVLVNLSEHEMFHNVCFASGCIPPLLHLLNHKRCAVSQSASCVLSALAEGGLSRDKLCQDTALLAMLRVLHTNHCVVVTLGVLYMLGRLASYRGQVVRSLKNWGAVQLLLRLQATTTDADAAEGCRQLLQLLGAQLPAAQSVQSAAAVPSGAGSKAPVKISLQSAYSSITMFEGATHGGERSQVPAAAGGLCRTISAAATASAAAGLGARSPPVAGCSDGPRRSLQAEAPRPSSITGHPLLGSFAMCSGVRGAAYSPMGPIAASISPAAAY
ncbi:hypothetical protein GPECTOR_63g7 [Gonium pectorale]|uniref:Armadillo repeat-containing domain-containing protein n=1 Tax=Gonium pectorale TaxID=33097 RepID=A0A150G5D4_GONPE|nr:hypothetical protein GPECTOR_63g7 [Gonium pectorale]|eukprot:KXZ44745.1 hypothetical protein GPECTOR_63g7 [Gonium pectorale]